MERESLPSRRKSDAPMRVKQLVYMTPRERRLIENAAGKARRTMSGFLVEAALEKAHQLLGLTDE